MTTFILDAESIQAFYPLLPDEYILPDPEGGLVVLGAVEENDDGTEKACGVLLMETLDEETWNISWLLVAPDARRRGAGAELMTQAEEVAAVTDKYLYCAFSEEVEQGEAGAIYSLFANRGYLMGNTGSCTYSISLGEMTREEFFCRESKSVSGLMKLNEVSDVSLAAMNRDLAQKGLMYVQPISARWALGDVSLIYMKDNTAMACAIFEQIGESCVQLSFVYADPSASMRLPLVLLKAHELLREKFGPETELVIPCVTETSRKLTKKLLPSAKVALRAYSALGKPEFE